MTAVGAAVLADMGFYPELREAALPMRRVLSRRADGTKLLDLDVHAAARAASGGWLVDDSGKKLTWQAGVG